MDRSVGGLIRSIVEQVVGARVDYLASHRARVVSQASDGTLDLQPLNDRIPALVGVRLGYGVPGISVKVKAGAIVLVSFEGGDPGSPVATVWDASAVAEMTVKADRVRLADGDRPLARKGDAVAVALTPAALSGAATGNVALAGIILDGASKVTGP